jgi:hypothetical protein
MHSFQSSATPSLIRPNILLRAQVSKTVVYVFALVRGTKMHIDKELWVELWY